jgi:hypothetical protein
MVKLKRKINLTKGQKNQNNEDQIRKKWHYKLKLNDEIENKSKFYKMVKNKN